MKKDDSKKVPPTKESTIQGRNFSYFAYPESMIPNLFDILLKDSDSSQNQENPYSILISPLHDSDLDDLGQPKKPHYHIMVMRKSEITLAGARRWGDLRGLILPEKCSKRGMARYLCHLDQKDKHLYNTEDVISYNCNYLEIIGSSVDKFAMYRDLLECIACNNFVYFSDFLDYCKDNNDDWFRFCCSGATYIIKEYINDRRRKVNNEYNNDLADLTRVMVRDKLKIG